MEASEVLDILRDTGALLEGHFELRSGLHSNRFFQCANVLQHPRQASRLCDALAREVGNALTDAGSRIDSVVAPALGGIVVGHEVARTLGVRSIFTEKQDDRLFLRPVREARHAVGTQPVGSALWDAAGEKVEDEYTGSGPGRSTF